MNQRDKKILVTGGAGFISSHLIPRLLDKGYAVVALDNMSSGKMENLSEVKDHSRFSLERGDVRDKSVLHETLRHVDAVVHLAGGTHDVNVTGTLNVLQEAARSKVERFVFASSTAVYGYAASKAAGEAYCCAFANCYDLSTIALRFFNVYGLRNENSPHSGVITKFLRKAVTGEELIIEGDGEQTRDFIHVSDVVSAIILALESEGLKGEVFNICTGVPTSINQLVDTLRVVAGRELCVKHGSPRVGDIRSNYGDPAKAIGQLGFKSNIDLLQGLNMIF
jgi:UDP-glucose 4-epimerase